MYVIALAGKKNRGKSHTLNIVYQLLLSDGYTQVKNLPPHFIFRILGNPVQEDFIDILQKRGKVIGFATMGDYYQGNKDDKGDTIKNLLKTLFDVGCTTAICACTTENLSKDESKIQLEIGLYPNIVLEKSVTNIQSQERIINNIDAQKIFNHI